MKRSMMLLFAAAGLCLVPTPAPPRAAALVGDPVITVVVSPASPVGGDKVTFHTCVTPTTFALSGQKITRTNTRTFSTINWANSSVLPRTVSGDCFDYTYQTSLSDVATTARYTFSVCTPVSAAYNPRLVCGSGPFTVSAPVTVPT